MRLEVESDFAGHGARGYVVRAAESREEVVERVLVGDVDAGEPEAPLYLSPLKRLSSPTRSRKVARGDARRVVVVVLGVRGGDADEGRGVLRCGADAGSGLWAWRGAIAGQAGLELLVGGEAAEIDGGYAIGVVVPTAGLFGSVAP